MRRGGMKLPMIYTQTTKVVCFMLFLTVKVNAETCEQFTPPPFKADCVRNKSDETPICYFDLLDQDCGMGVAIIDYINCPPEGIKCCRPCSRRVIHDKSCSANYCIYGRLPPGDVYKEGDCEYVSGKWSDCHFDLLIRKREDKLIVVKSDVSCKPINVIEKVCPYTEVNSDKNPPEEQQERPEMKANLIEAESPLQENAAQHNSSTTTEATKLKDDKQCSYSTLTTWSSCDPHTLTRNLQRQLDIESSTPDCAGNKTEIRPCFTKTGKERCFYTKWSRWSPCTNFIQRRERDILYGQSSDCTRNVKIRTCQPPDQEQLNKRHKLKKSKRG